MIIQKPLTLRRENWYVNMQQDKKLKTFLKGKRFGPPPLKGPDPQGLQVILENSDYFNKLIG